MTIRERPNFNSKQEFILNNPSVDFIRPTIDYPEGLTPDELTQFTYEDADFAKEYIEKNGLMFRVQNIVDQFLGDISIDQKSEDEPKGKILDIGCGPGQYAYLLGSKGFHVLGIDTSQKMIDNAKNLANIVSQYEDPERKKLIFINCFRLSQQGNQYFGQNLHKLTYYKYIIQLLLSRIIFIPQGVF